MQSDKESILKRGSEAKAILEHPLVTDFLKKEREESFKVLTTQMPSNSIDYLALHAYVAALSKFEKYLELHIERAANLLIKQTYNEQRGKTI